MQEADFIDFKSNYSPDNRAEMAKDMAAFANALGGTILIGTSEDDKPLMYPGLPRTFAERLCDGFADAHARHLSPKPPGIERIAIPLPNSDKVIVSINILPFSDQIVGARIKQDIWVFPEREIPAWRFPIRVGVDTNFLEPAMLPLYSASIRRNLVLLGNVDPRTAKVVICFRNPTNRTTREPIYWDATEVGVLLSKNSLVVHLEETPALAHRIPLNDIDCVWDSGTHESPRWVIRVLGHFTGTTPGSRKYHSNPSNASFDGS